MFKGLSLGKRIGIVFGMSMALLLVVSGGSLLGINGLIGEAQEAIDRSSLQAELVRMEGELHPGALPVKELLDSQEELIQRALRTEQAILLVSLLALVLEAAGV